MRNFFILIVFSLTATCYHGQEIDFEYKNDSAKTDSTKLIKSTLFSQEALSFDGINDDSIHSSFVSSISYKSDTLFIAVRYYSMCCQKFITYIEPNEDVSRINFVVKSLETNCICVAEKFENYQIYAKNLDNNVKLRINGKTPKFGVTEFVNSNVASKPKRRRKKKKK